jgi:acetylornithine deacetylase
MSRLDDRALLARLVAFDTTSALTNLPLVDFLCDYLDRPGVRIARQPSDDGTKANLVVTAGPAGAARAIEKTLAPPPRGAARRSA